MGSGIFPLRTGDPGYDKLVEAADLIDAVHHEWQDSIYSGDSGGGQFDNAASDGASLALLDLAEKLIRDELRE